MIGIAVCTPNLRRLVKGWHASEEVSLSDHMYIRYILEKMEVAPTYYRNPRNNNWNGYREGLQDKCRISLVALAGKDSDVR